MRNTIPGLKLIHREGSIEDGDIPLTIISSCRIRNEIYHMVIFKQRSVEEGTLTARATIREQIRPTIYKNKELRKIAPQFLVDYYES